MLRRFLIFFLILGLFAFPAQVAQAAAITVDGACTLADAISAANSDSAVGGCAAGSGADVITLDGDVSLTSPLPDVVSTITIEGNGHVIARTGGPAFRLFTIVNGDLTINRVTLTGGHETSDMLSYYDNGSAVYMASGAFTLQNSTVTGNLLDGGVFSLGAALMASSGNMTILDSTIVNNVVNLDDGELGAGVASFDSLVMYRSIVSGNTYNGAPVQVETFAYTGGDNIFGQEGDAGVVNFTPGPTDIVPTGATSTIYGAYAAGIHPLVAGSPALDAASSGPAVDQLGVTRPEGSAYDIGAAEYPENHPPTAHTGTLFAIQDATLCTPHIVPIMQGFDIDPYEEDLVFIILTSVQHGSIIFDPPTVGAGNEGSWISGEACYTPNPGFVGTDFFTYQVSDGLLSSAIATTTLLVGAVNTPTPTATNTAEATVASTPTATATNTTEPTATATATATPTATATDTPEPTATPTATATPTPTATPTATATATATPLPTVTSTATATDTPEPTATPTATATSTPTATPTATATDTPEPTATPTATLVPNNPPDCTTAYAEPALLWPPNHAMQPIMVLGVTDPESQPLTFVVNSVWQDEPTDGTGDGDTAVDATLAPLVVRAERSGNGNGRVYHITLTASDSAGGSCTTEVQVGVPHSKKKLPVDGGALYDSTN